MKTDQRLQDDVRAELRWDPAIDAAAIGVDVKDGVVSLSGEVASHAARWHALQAVLRVAGVHALASGLTVRVPAPERRSDQELAAAVADRLAWQANLGEHVIEVGVADGRVTLTGVLTWQFQREAALSCVRALRGVRGVHDRLRLSPATGGPIDGALVEAALARTAAPRATDVRVRVDGADVILSGTVPHWLGRDAAVRAAWSVPGVRQVVDHLHLRG